MKPINAFTIEGYNTLKTDICIVGGGAAGITIAREFIGSQYIVLVLESGSNFFHKKTQSLYDFENVGHPLRADEGFICRNRYLGGTTNTWGGLCAPLNSIDFEQREWVPDSGWPITKSDLDEYYVKAAKVLKIPNSKDFNIPKWENLAKKSNQQDRINKDIFNLEYLLLPSRPLNMRVEYTEQLQNSPNIRICLNANVVEVEPNPSLKTINRVHVVSLRGNTFFVEAKIYILACGGWENARLLLLSQRYCNNGLGNQNDNLGRYYMEHPKIKWGSISPISKRGESFFYLGEILKRRRIENGYLEGGIRLSNQIQRDERLLNHYIRLSSAFGGRTIIQKTQSIKTLWRYLNQNMMLLYGSNKPFHETLQKFKDAVRFSLDFSNSTRKELNVILPYEILLVENHFEQRPNRESRVLLSRQKDILSKNRLQVNLKITSEEKHDIIRFHQILGKFIEDNNIGYLTSEFPDIDHIWHGLTDSSHHMGTTRMTSTPKNGVVDKNCRVHGINNLYIAGSSIFPTGGHINPTLTIVALALRLATHLRIGVLPKI